MDFLLKIQGIPDLHGFVQKARCFILRRQPLAGTRDRPAALSSSSGWCSGDQLRCLNQVNKVPVRLAI
jgi:hypothetical protein